MLGVLAGLAVTAAGGTAWYYSQQVGVTVEANTADGELSDEARALLEELQQKVALGWWEVVDSKDPFTDVPIVAASVDSVAHTSTAAAPTLLVRCLEGETAVLIDWHVPLGGGNALTKHVVARVGEDPPEALQQWPKSENEQATFAPMEPVGLLRRMLTADRLAAKVEPPRRDPITAIFLLQGIEIALEPIMRACDWSAEG